MGIKCNPLLGVLRSINKHLDTRKYIDILLYKDAIGLYGNSGDSVERKGTSVLKSKK